MELGRIKDQLNAVLDRMETVDPCSEEYEVLTKRANEIRKIILDEEQRRIQESQVNDKTSRELELRELELEERRKDRWLKFWLAIGGGALGLASIFADETRVACKAGLDTVDRVRKIIH